MKKTLILLLVVLCFQSYGQRKKAKSDQEFNRLVASAQTAIENNDYPLNYLRKADGIKKDQPEVLLLWAKFNFQEKQWFPAFNRFGKYLKTNQDTAVIRMQAEAGLKFYANQRKPSDVVDQVIDNYSLLIDQYGREDLLLGRSISYYQKGLKTDQESATGLFAKACQDLARYQELNGDEIEINQGLKSVCK